MDKILSWGLVILAVVTAWATFFSDNHLYIG
jgi:hypothetical protein